MNQHIRVKKIWQSDATTLGIVWSDNMETLFDVVELRRKCPCAECIDEWTGEQRLMPEQVPDTVRPVTINSVGRYALNIEFSDGHKTGIYSFSYLRELSGIRASS